MKQSSLTVILLMFVFVCFISMSALSSEDPWDADQRQQLGSQGGSNSSSSTNFESLIISSYLDSPFEILFDVTFRFVIWYGDSNSNDLRTGRFVRELDKK